MAHPEWTVSLRLCLGCARLREALRSCARLCQAALASFRELMHDHKVHTHARDVLLTVLESIAERSIRARYLHRLQQAYRQLESSYPIWDLSGSAASACKPEEHTRASNWTEVKNTFAARAELCELCELCEAVRSCAKLCEAVRGCARLCQAVSSSARLCQAVPGCAKLHD